MLNLPETPAQMGMFQRIFGVTPIRYLSQSNLLGPHLTLCHCLFFDEAEQRQLEKTGTRMIYSIPLVGDDGPSLSFWKRPSTKFKLAIGTGYQSGDMLHILKEIESRENFYSGANDQVIASDLFYAATVGGAKALGREDVGRIVEGYRADILVLNTRRSHFRPLTFPLASIIDHGGLSDIETVISGGKIVKHEGRLIHSEGMTASEQAEQAVWKSWSHCRKHGIL